MTTQLIASTSSAPSLTERAIAEHRRQVAQMDAEHAERTRADFARRVDVLRIHLRDKIGMADSDSVVISEIAQHSSGGFIATTADGLRFSLRDLPYADNYRDREQLHVAVRCDRDCGKDLWVNVNSLYELGVALDDEVTHTHDFSCLQQFDDDGDPITDVTGNLLPKRLPIAFVASPEQNARFAIAALENAADRLSFAINTVTELEDARALIKGEAIRRLMESGAYTSATSAEKYVEADAIYSAHHAAQRVAEIEKHRAHAAYDACKLAATLDVALAATLMRGSE